MNDDLIRKFREKVNSEEFVYEHFKNVDGKSYWSIICSAMDWISVSVSSIEFEFFVPALGEDDKATWDALLLLMQVAAVKDAVVQLHRVFFPDEKPYRSEDQIVWESNEFGSTDDEYFEMLRACFGAHSVNLKNPYKADKERKYYASWPAGINEGFSVYLYSNDTEADDKSRITITLNLKKLQEYFMLRYNHLNDLIDQIEKMKLKEGNACKEE